MFQMVTATVADMASAGVPRNEHSFCLKGFVASYQFGGGWEILHPAETS